MTVYQNLVEMLEIATQARAKAEADGDEKAIAKWEVRIIEAHRELTKFA